MSWVARWCGSPCRGPGAGGQEPAWSVEEQQEASVVGVEGRGGSRGSRWAVLWAVVRTAACTLKELGATGSFEQRGGPG